MTILSPHVSSAWIPQLSAFQVLRCPEDETVCPILPCAKYHGNMVTRTQFSMIPALERHSVSWTMELSSGLFWLFSGGGNPSGLQDHWSSPVLSLSTSPTCVPRKKSPFSSSLCFCTTSFSSEKVKELGHSGHRQLAHQMKKFH